MTTKKIDKATGFPIVGIGASAGGLAAFEAFFSGMPAQKDPGMAFVIVQHLAPDHASILTELIRRYTRMQVFEVEDGMMVKVNCAYIIPPNRDMAFYDGKLILTEPSAPRGQRLPIDFFFRSLAQDQHERAICIVLSGTGSDGTLGVRAIKGEGGMAIAQQPESTEYDGMPRNAIATGLVDYVLPPAEMPARIMEYVAYSFGNLPHAKNEPLSRVSHALKQMFSLLRDQTGHDFSHYKPSTIHRRIERRMAVHQIETMDGYVKYIQQTPIEVDALFRDLLIGVTNFFRDPEAFQVLEKKAIPILFENKLSDASVRVWSAGCSTGEEAYSIAILLQERMEDLKENYKLQVFATDIDSQAIDTARAGVYPASIAADISPERLARFFIAQPDGSTYRIKKVIRDMLVFSEQNVIKDPPFSKIDLISCRNLMIYMGVELQKKLIPLFHYALNPGGILFLGTSETLGEFDNMFATIDRKSKLYQRKEVLSGVRSGTFGQFQEPRTTRLEAVAMTTEKKAFPAKLSLRELTMDALLQQVAPSAALVNGQGDILYLHGRTGIYLEPAIGEVGIYNILKMAREGLRHQLTMSLRKAAKTNQVVLFPGLNVKTNGHFTRVNLTICPVTADSAATMEVPLFLIILEEAPISDIVNSDQSADDVRIAALKKELLLKEEYLKTTNEELENANQELKSSNEEMQSINEEFQSTNEELETSKEELQSVNEELATVNAELQTKVTDLSRANNDMNNLLSGTGIGTVFVDHQLRILRFTPAAARIINLILTDVGRPVAHIASNLVNYDHLVADTQKVLDTLAHKEEDVQTRDGKWYKMRIMPYRTLENVIEGAVITFVDISEMKRAEEAMTVSEIRYRRLFETAKDGILILDAETGIIKDVNPYMIEMLGYSKEKFIEKSIWDIGFFKDIIANQQNFLELQQEEYIRYDDLPLETADGRRINVEFVSNVYLVNKQKVIQCNIRNITDRKLIENALKRSETLLRTIQKLTSVGGWEWDINKQTMFWTDEMYHIHDIEPGELVKGTDYIERSQACFLPADRKIIQAAFRKCAENGEPYDFEFPFTTAKGRKLWVRTLAEAVREKEKIIQVVGFIMDITNRRPPDWVNHRAKSAKTENDGVKN